MAKLTARLWRRYGRTRIYVDTEDGDRVGWYDPVTGTHRLTEPALSQEFWATATAECERLHAAGRIGEPVPPEAAGPGPGGTGPTDENAQDPGAAGRMGENIDEPPANRADTDAVDAGIPPQATDRRGSGPGAGHAPDAPAPPDPGRIPEPRTAPDDGGYDLAVHKPGQGVRDHARELRRAHPVRTRLARLVGVRTDARSFAEGAGGERTVGRYLDRRAPRHGWHVLHGIQVSERGTDIDHVVIGPFGVVTVNTKRTSASVRVGDHTIWVGGHQVPYLATSRAEARRTTALLGAVGLNVPVRPALVFVGQSGFSRARRYEQGQTDVCVLPGPHALREWIARLPCVLDDDTVARLYATARRSRTWLP